MAVPRRAAVADDGPEVVSVTIARRGLEPASAPPRRIARIVLAPLAALSVTGLAASLLLLPPTEDRAVENPVALQAEPLGTSRNQGRTPLAPEPTPTVDVALDTAAATDLDEELTPATQEPTEAVAEPTVEAEPTAEAEAAVETSAPAAPETTEPAPEPTETAPAFDPAALGEAAGTRYATASVNVRTGPGTDFEVRRAIAPGEEVTITNIERDGWHQVVLAKKAGWIKATYLTDTKPKVQAATTSSSSSGGFSTAPCANAAGAEQGLTERTRNVLRAVCAEFPKVSSYGGKRAGGGNHGAGKAIDVMVSGSYGWEIANWARQNAGALGITEVIYEQKIWTTQRAGEGWRGMANRGSVSANHYDHVHLSVR